jgi:PAS domain S-box-containing protein
MMGEGVTNGRQTSDETKDPRLQEMAVTETTLWTGNTTQEFRIELFQQYRSAIDRVSEAVCILQNGCFVFVNRKMSDILKVPAEKLEGSPFPDFVWPADRELIVTNYGKRLRRERFRIPTSSVVGAGGRLTWVALSATILMHRETVRRSVLDQRHYGAQAAEEALRRSEARFRMLV